MQQHVLRFWETKFPFIRPTKRAGGRRFYRPQDIELLMGVKTLLYDRGYTIRGVQKLFKDEGQKAILSTGNEPAGSYVTEQGVVPEEPMADDAAQARKSMFDFSEDIEGLQAKMLSQETRESFLNIAKALEEAQEHLGRHIGRTGGRGQPRGKFS
ncbi:merR family transcriptional regulator [Asticcacaulis biprosthecium C19]|uniref:MerR family transcriptional regulator n=1 Tax=Asticcacaulis biprosthecium C19 TaxID=715226 RepID=F4QQJ5_9CAUL|nr:merR family transcriptional regulator [Asticcacaulis biprosthecium C19]